MRSTTNRNLHLSGKELKKIAYSEASSSSEHTHKDNKTMGEILTDILGAADRHPNSRVSKLIRLVEEQPSQKNIVILLIELSDHAEFATELNISLRYYLEKFEKSVNDGDVILNEAGMLLLSSSKIYSKRVDYIQDLVEHQIMTLSNADNEIQQETKKNQQKDDKAIPPVKRKRGRKRALGASTDPYEVEVKRKTIKKISEEKRFAAPVNKTTPKKKIQFRNIEMEQQCHPMGWKYATIYDLDDEEDFDTKRNYKLFSYHIEHRFNTLVPDINFRLHYKVKDYLIAQDREMDVDSTRNPFYQEVWPSNSQEYLDKYISLENRVLHQEINPYESRERDDDDVDYDDDDSDDELATENINDMWRAHLNVAGLGEKNVEDYNLNLNTSDTGLSEKNVADNNLCLRLNDLGAAEKNVEGDILSLGLNDSGLSEKNVAVDNLSLRLNNSGVAEKNVEDDNLRLGGINDIGLSKNTVADASLSLNDSGAIFSDSESFMERDTDQPENITVSKDNTIDQGNSTISEQTMPQENATSTENKSLANTSNMSEGEMDKSLNVSETQTENDSALGSSMLDHSHSTNETTTEFNMTVVSTECRESIIKDKTNTVEIPMEATDSELDHTGSANLNSCIVSESSPEAGENPNDLVTNKENQSTKNQEGNGCLESTITKEIQATNTEEIENNLAITNSNSSKKSSDSYQVEIEIVNEDGKAESNTIQIHIPNSNDDEGVHLSDAFESDFKLLSPNLKTPDIMQGVKRNDITIYMDKELREALEIHNSLADHYSQETYTVPVIIEPIAQPLVLNILQLPPKMLKRKTLFKLGPDMNLYLQSRLQKSGKTREPPRTHRVLQSFPVDTPPDSPGNVSDFLGFTDDDETICEDFCGFSEEEQMKLLCSRLSRDSGVGVDTSVLTSERQTLDVIFEDNATAPSCSLDLDKILIDVDNGTGQNSTEDLLHTLPAALRDVLKAEIEDSVVNGSSQGAECNKENDSLTISVKQELLEPQTANETDNNGEINCLSLNANGNEKETLPDHQALQSGVLNLSDEHTEETISKESTVPSTVQEIIESEQQPDINSSGVQEACDANGAEPNDNPKTTDERAVCSENSVSTNGEANNDWGCQQNDIDIELYGLESLGAKTKIEQWHDYLRPILAKSKERHHFDVFKLGTEIIDRMHSEENAEVKQPIATFANIMDNKDKSYASRYFLSTLLLANQSNIDISVKNKSSELPSSWSDIQLKLISTKRHTVAIEDNIGMINENKRKISTAPIAEKSNNKKRKMSKKTRIGNSADAEDEDEDSSDEDCEPLVNLKSKKSSTHRPPRPIDKEENSNYRKRTISATASDVLTPKRPREMLVTSQIFLPPINDLPIMPSTNRIKILVCLQGINCFV